MTNRLNTDVTFVIQGPYSKIHLTMIDSLLQLGRIILSCYKSDMAKIDPHDLDKYDVIVFNELVEKPEDLGIYNHQNVYRQIYSTLGGLKHVETKFVVKLRCDNAYSNIPYILDVIRNNPEKYCTATFSADPYCMFNFGDHIIAGSTENIRNTFETAYNLVKTIDFNNPDTYTYDNMDVRSSGENLFTIANLKSKNIKLGDPIMTYWMESFKRPGLKSYVTIGENYEQVLLDNYFLFDMGKLWPYEAKSGTIQYTFTEDKDLDRVRSIEEYISKFKQLHKSSLPIPSDDEYNNIVSEHMKYITKHEHLIDLSKTFNLNFHLDFYDHNRGLKMSNKLSPVSVTEFEYGLLYSLVLHNNTKFAFEIATGFGVSACAIGQALSKTEGKLITMDAYVEEALDEYTHKTKFVRNESSSQGYAIAKKMCNVIGISAFVNIEIGWSPDDVSSIMNKNFGQNKLDFVFIDGGHEHKQIIADLNVIFPYVGDDCVLAFHDYRWFSDEILQLIKSNGFTTFKDYKTNYAFAAYVKGNKTLI
jgi:predicted O-methyltransferase YrrM